MMSSISHLVGLVRVRVGFEDEHDEHDEEESEKEPSPQTSSVPKIYPGSQIDANRNFLFFNTFSVQR